MQLWILNKFLGPGLIDLKMAHIFIDYLLHKVAVRMDLECMKKCLGKYITKNKDTLCIHLFFLLISFSVSGLISLMEMTNRNQNIKRDDSHPTNRTHSSQINKNNWKSSGRK